MKGRKSGDAGLVEFRRLSHASVTRTMSPTWSCMFLQCFVNGFQEFVFGEEPGVPVIVPTRMGCSGDNLSRVKVGYNNVTVSHEFNDLHDRVLSHKVVPTIDHRALCDGVRNPGDDIADLKSLVLECHF